MTSDAGIFHAAKLLIDQPREDATLRAAERLSGSPVPSPS
jgi:hypothetical protein